MLRTWYSNGVALRKDGKKDRRHPPEQLLTQAALKQRRVLKNLDAQAKRGERLSVKRAVIEAGYSEGYASNNSITRTKTWKKLMEKALPDSLLLKVHKEGLRANSTIYATHEGQIVDTQEVPDYTNRFRYLDSGYKLKGKYEPTEHKITERRSLAEIEDEIAATLSEISGLV